MSKAVGLLTLTEGAGGFLPGVPMGRLGMGEPQRPRPTVEETGVEGPGLREAMSDNHTQKSNAGRSVTFRCMCIRLQC